MLMPIGKFKGKPVADMTTSYLCWLICNDAIRFKRWPLVREALSVLRARFDRFEDMVAELQVSNAPPEYWKTNKPDRKAEKAEKLRQLVVSRIEEKNARVAAFRERRRQQLEEELRRRQAEKGDGDVSDLL